jgi:hypothetical protein
MHNLITVAWSWQLYHTNKVMLEGVGVDLLQPVAWFLRLLDWVVFLRLVDHVITYLGDPPTRS